jgi:hypothetical protein
VKEKHTISLILAAGEAVRFNGTLKQLLPVGDKTIITRMLVQLRERHTRAIIVTHKGAISCCHSRFHDPENHDTVCDSLLSTDHLWDDRTIVLLGDVVYSENVMDMIVNCHSPIRVFGNTWEIFALVFDKSVHTKVKKHLRIARKHKLGKLRYFYRSYCGFDLDVEEIESEPPECDVFHYVRDWTRDVDSQYEHERLLLEMQE